jgi:hypothetical protein
MNKQHSNHCDDIATALAVRAREARREALRESAIEERLQQIRDVAFSAREFRTGKVPTPVCDACEHFGCMAARALTVIRALMGPET